jgi:hypothetical protein
MVYGIPPARQERLRLNLKELGVVFAHTRLGKGLFNANNQRFLRYQKYNMNKNQVQA